MNGFTKIAGAATVLLALVVTPALAIDAQPGGRGGAAATIGAPVTDADDQEIDRCECNGGPLEEVELFRSGGGTRTTDIEDIIGAVVETRDGVVVGTVTRMGNNSGDGAILIYVLVEPGVLGDVERINVRRTGFYWDGQPIIDTTIGDLRNSVEDAVAAGA